MKTKTQGDDAQRTTHDDWYATIDGNLPSRRMPFLPITNWHPWLLHTWSQPRRLHAALQGCREAGDLIWVSRRLFSAADTGATWPIRFGVDLLWFAMGRGWVGTLVGLGQAGLLQVWIWMGWFYWFVWFWQRNPVVLRWRIVKSSRALEGISGVVRLWCCFAFVCFPEEQSLHMDSLTSFSGYHTQYTHLRLRSIQNLPRFVYTTCRERKNKTKQLYTCSSHPQPA